LEPAVHPAGAEGLVAPVTTDANTHRELPASSFGCDGTPQHDAPALAQLADATLKIPALLGLRVQLLDPLYELLVFPIQLLDPSIKQDQFHAGGSLDLVGRGHPGHLV